MSETITIVRQCPSCPTVQELTVDKAAYEAWQRGAYIQDAFPRLSDNEREMLLMGICRACWASIMGDTIAEDECSGVCLTGYDVGVPSDAIAAAHPDCPLHGYPREEVSVSDEPAKTTRPGNPPKPPGW